MWCVCLASLGMQACDAVGGASRPEWSEWPGMARPNSISQMQRVRCFITSVLALYPSREETSQLHLGHSLFRSMLATFGELRELRVIRQEVLRARRLVPYAASMFFR